MPKLTRKGSTLYFDGGECAELGINAYSLLEKVWASGWTDTTYQTDLPLLKQNGFNLIKVMFGPIDGVNGSVGWDVVVGTTIPTQWTDLSANYRNLVTDFFNRAEAAGISVIPVLFWNNLAVPDALAESYTAAFTNENSNSNQYYSGFIDVFVNQFLTHNAVAAWCVGTEWAVVRNNQTYNQYNHNRFRLHNRLARRIKSIDSERVVIANTIGLPATSIDVNRITLQRACNEWVEAARDFDCVDVHCYPTTLYAGSAAASGGYGNLDQIGRVFSTLREAAERSGKCFVVTEFGVSGDQQAAPATTMFDQMLSELKRAKVQLAMAWNWNASYAGTQDLWNIYPGYSYGGGNRGDTYLASMAAARPWKFSNTTKSFISTWIRGTPNQSQCARFNVGTIRIPAAARYNVSTCTVMFWARPRIGSTYGAIVRYANAVNSPTRGWSVVLDTNIQAPLFYSALYYSGGNGQNTAGMLPRIDLRRWHHYIFQVSASGSNGIRRRVVFDGLMWREDPSAISFDANDGTLGIDIGSNGHVQQYFLGDIADVVFYDRIVTPEEYQDYYSDNILPINPVGRWTLDGNTNDSSGYANNGSISGNVSFVNIEKNYDVSRAVVPTRSISNSVTIDAIRKLKIN